MTERSQIWLWANATSLACAIGAAVAICLRVPSGWGWLLCIALFTHSTESSRDEGEKP